MSEQGWEPGQEVAQLRANLKAMDDWLATVDADRERERAAWAAKRDDLIDRIIWQTTQRTLRHRDAFAVRLREAVDQRGKTQNDIAAHMEIDPTALSKILAGKRGLSSLELALFAEATDTPVEALLYDDGDTAARPYICRHGAIYPAPTAPTTRKARDMPTPPVVTFHVLLAVDVPIDPDNYPDKSDPDRARNLAESVAGVASEHLADVRLVSATQCLRDIGDAASEPTRGRWVQVTEHGSRTWVNEGDPLPPEAQPFLTGPDRADDPEPLTHTSSHVTALRAARDAAVAEAARARADLSDTQEAVHADLRAILLALGIGDHARSYSSHDVVQREVLPAIRAIRAHEPNAAAPRDSETDREETQR